MLRFVGVDGCRLGWLSVALNGQGAWEVGTHEAFSDLWSAHQKSTQILVDVPIGLRSEGKKERACDKQARRLLGPPRGSTVFRAPCRAALAARDYAEAKQLNRERTGCGLSKQAWAIMPKIAEVDQLLRSLPEPRRVVREVHPEILFWALNAGGRLVHKKKRTAGFEERLGILQRLHPKTDEIVAYARSRWKLREVARDDILDTLAAAVTAKLGQDGLETVPAEPEVDEEGLPMEMVYVRADRLR